MNKALKSITAISLAALMLTSTVSMTATAAKSYADKIEQTKDEISNSKAEIDALNNQLSKKEEERKKNQAALAELEKENQLTLEKKYLLDMEMNYLISQIDLTQDIIEEYKVSIELKKAEIAATEASIRKQRELFTEHFRNEYEQGSSKLKYLEFLFNSSSIGDFLTAMHYVASMMDYEQYLIKDMQTLIVRLESQNADLNATLAEQETYEAQLSADLEEVEVLNQQTEEYMLKLMADEEMYEKFNQELDDDMELIANEIEKKAEAYDALVKTKEELEKQEQERIEAEKKAEEERKRLEELLAQQQSKPNGGNNSNNNNSGSSGDKNVNAAGIAFDNNSAGTWQWPVNYHLGKWTSPFGSRTDPVTGEKDTHHNGVDLALAKGNNIYAVDAGVVITSEYHRSYGNYVIVLHDNGMKTLYAHASKLLVRVGDQVARGTVLALVGTTGKSTGNHLHFTVYAAGYNKKDVNPFNYYPTLSRGLRLYD